MKRSHKRLKVYPRPKSFQFWNQCRRETHPAWNTLNFYADYRLVVVTHYPWITVILTILTLIYLIQLYLLVLLRILCRTGSSWGNMNLLPTTHFNTLTLEHRWFQMVAKYQKWRIQGLRASIDFHDEPELMACPWKKAARTQLRSYHRHALFSLK